MRTYASGVCAACGQELVCAKCGYTEPPIFMQSRHDFETEVALLDNVQLQMPELWSKLQAAGCYSDNKAMLFLGAYVYRIPKATQPQIPRRVVRIPRTIFEARGNRFKKCDNYTERRASDKRSLKGYLSAHRIAVRSEA